MTKTTDKIEQRMSAREYAQVIDILFPKVSKPVICKALSISRPTHDKRLAVGIPHEGKAKAFRLELGQRVSGLRARARALDPHTTPNLKS